MERDIAHLKAAVDAADDIDSSVILFGWLMTTGPGRFSIDHHLAKGLGVVED